MASSNDGHAVVSKKQPFSYVAFDVLNYVLFGLFTIICAYPFYYLIINSISNNEVSARGEVLWYPIGLQFKNYVSVSKLNGLSRAALVTIGRTVLGTIGTCLGCSYLGFMFTQEKMWHRKFWYRFVVATMYFSAGLIPQFITMKALGLTNTFWIYIIPAIVQPYNIILIKTYIESTPKELQEAAEVDGAGIMTVFFKVMIPLIKPIMATIAIFAAVAQWNAFQDTLIYITDAKLHTLQFTLYQYINQAASLAKLVEANNGEIADLATQQTPTSVRMTVAVVVVLPVLTVYPIFQRFFVKGIMIGAVKG